MQHSSDRVEEVRARARRACERVGRQAEEVKLIAVTKTFGPEVVREAAACGLTIFGENKVQEARVKIPECPGHLTWHLVGHLQTNKVRLAIELFDFIHSVDSVKLLQTLNRVCDEVGKDMPVCVEVNVAGEASKFGIPPDTLPEVLEASVACPRVTVAGLMTLPPFCPEPEKARGYFRTLRELKDRCREQYQFPMTELSMGMSHDFEVAIEEGATMIRVGTALFGDRTS